MTLPENLKTAKQLKITQAEFDGLVRLHGYFCERTIPVIHGDDLGFASSYLDEDVIRSAMGFSMTFGTAVVNDNEDSYSCGCAACIGGHLSLAMQGADIAGTCFTRDALVEANAYVNKAEGHPTLEGLFYPRAIYTNDWSRITAPMAAGAISNFLGTGDAKWVEIARENGLRTRTGY